MNSRRKRPANYDRSVENTKRSAGIMVAFNTRRLVTLNALHALVDPTSSYDAFGNLASHMWKAGLIGRRTYANGHASNNETMTYWREALGVKWMEHYAHPTLVTYAGDRSTDAERCLVDHATASIEVQTRKSPDITFGSYEKTLARSFGNIPDKAGLFFPTGEMYVTESGKKKERRISPDGEPFTLSAPTPDGSKIESIDFITEVTRFNKTEHVIREKARLYKKVKRNIEKRLGTTSIFVLFIATNKENAKNIVRWIKEEVGECQWMLVQTMTDHIREGLTTAPLVPHLFEEPWDRAYPSMFSLKELRSVRRPGIAQEPNATWRLSQPGGFSIHPTEKAAYELQQINAQKPPAKKPTKSFFEREIERYNEQGGFGFAPNIVREAERRKANDELTRLYDENQKLKKEPTN